MISISEHGGTLGGSERPIKYPIKYRKVGADSVKRGDKLWMKPNGEVTNVLEHKLSNPIITDLSDMNVPSQGAVYHQNYKILKSGKYTVVVSNGTSKVVANVYEFDKQKLVKQSNTLVIASGQTVNEDLECVLLTPTTILLTYTITNNAGTYWHYADVIDFTDINNVRTWGVTVLTSGDAGSTYRSGDLNIFHLSNDVKRVYYIGTREIGGSAVRYFDVNLVNHSISSAKLYEGVFNTNNMNNYSRRTNTIVYKASGNKTYAYVLGKIFTGGVTYQLQIIEFDHVACKFVQLPIRGDSQSLSWSGSTLHYNKSSNFGIAKDRSYLFFQMEYSASNGVGFRKVSLNPDGTSPTDGHMYFGKVSTDSSESVSDAVVNHLEGNKFLISFSYRTNVNLGGYVAVIDFAQEDRNTVYYRTNDVRDLAQTSQFIRTSNYNEFFSMSLFGAVENWRYGYRFIDFDYSNINAIAKQAGVKGELIEVYQVTTHS